MKRTVGFALALILGAGLLSGLVGCSKDSNPTQVTSPTDQTVLKQQVATIDSIAQFSSSDVATIDDGDGLKASEYEDMSGSMTMPVTGMAMAGTDSIYPVRWGRHLDWKNITVNYNVVMQGDTFATVFITKSIPGDFRVGLGTRTTDTTIVDTVLHKSFTEQVERKVLFKRIARTSNIEHNWIPVAITMVQGMTTGGNHFQIASVKVRESGGSYDSTFTDPLNTWFTLGLRHGSIPVFPVRDSLTVTVTLSSSDSAAELVHLRHGVAAGHPERRRLKLNLISTTGEAGNYTRVYERSFRTGLPSWAILAARFNLVVDVISKGSIYDNATPFMNEYWGAPYIVARW